MKAFNISNLLDTIERVEEEKAERILESVKAKTPKDTGYARSRWKIVKGPNGISLTNDAPYIKYLEYGNGRTQGSQMVARTLAEERARQGGM